MIDDFLDYRVSLVKLIIPIGSREFNLWTLFIFSAMATVVMAIALQFNFFHLDYSTIHGLLVGNRANRDPNFILVLIKLIPWIVSVTLIAMGLYLGIEPTESEWASAIAGFEDKHGKLPSRIRRTVNERSDQD